MAIRLWGAQPADEKRPLPGDELLLKDWTQIRTVDPTPAVVGHDHPASRARGCDAAACDAADSPLRWMIDCTSTGLSTTGADIRVPRISVDSSRAATSRIILGTINQRAIRQGAAADGLGPRAAEHVVVRPWLDRVGRPSLKLAPVHRERLLLPCHPRR